MFKSDKCQKNKKYCLLKLNSCFRLAYRKLLGELTCGKKKKKKSVGPEETFYLKRNHCESFYEVNIL